MLLNSVSHVTDLEHRTADTDAAVVAVVICDDILCVRQTSLGKMRIINTAFVNDKKNYTVQFVHDK